MDLDILPQLLVRTLLDVEELRQPLLVHLRVIEQLLPTRDVGTDHILDIILELEPLRSEFLCGYGQPSPRFRPPDINSSRCLHQVHNEDSFPIIYRTGCHLDMCLIDEIVRLRIHHIRPVSLRSEGGFHRIIHTLTLRQHLEAGTEGLGDRLEPTPLRHPLGSLSDTTEGGSGAWDFHPHPPHPTLEDGWCLPSRNSHELLGCEATGRSLRQSMLRGEKWSTTGDGLAESSLASLRQPGQPRPRTQRDVGDRIEKDIRRQSDHESSHLVTQGGILPEWVTEFDEVGVRTNLGTFLLRDPSEDPLTELGEEGDVPFDATLRSDVEEAEEVIPEASLPPWSWAGGDCSLGVEAVDRLLKTPESVRGLGGHGDYLGGLMPRRTSRVPGSINGVLVIFLPICPIFLSRRPNPGASGRVKFRERPSTISDR